ncbi:MAG: DUF512 domain-containing protein [Clostridiales bacterium]|jgi:NifB/MoaA-like Fe-S oxidoreductase|nr:DUF512 domain-containing protein [Clostridiales bacterium]
MAVIIGFERGGILKKYGFKKGDDVAAFDGFEYTDYLDYIFFDAKDEFDITVLRAENTRDSVNAEEKNVGVQALNAENSVNSKGNENDILAFGTGGFGNAKGKKNDISAFGTGGFGNAKGKKNDVSAFGAGGFGNAKGNENDISAFGAGGFGNAKGNKNDISTFGAGDIGNAKGNKNDVSAFGTEHIGNSKKSLNENKKKFEVITKHIKKKPGQSMGALFGEENIEPILCRNKCIFCFVDQMKKGMRDTLYVKDDDYRLSFISGNYITLTNLSEKEISRIKRLKLSPLYVSVHAFDAEVRKKMLGNRFAGRLSGILKEFGEAGVFCHTQIVLVEGVNDGEILRETVAELYKLPSVLSVAIVPVGLTGFRKGLTKIEPLSIECINQTIDFAENFAKKAMKKEGRFERKKGGAAEKTEGRKGNSVEESRDAEGGFESGIENFAENVKSGFSGSVIDGIKDFADGTGGVAEREMDGTDNSAFVWCSDEMYIRAGRELPPFEYYGDFCQIENGVGLAARFVHDAREYFEDENISCGADECVFCGSYNEKNEAKNGENTEKNGEKVFRIEMITGVSFYKIMVETAAFFEEKIKNIKINVTAVKNNFFGESVTVAGLLTGRDIVEQFKPPRRTDLVLIPQAMLKEFEDVFLDGMTVGELAEILGTEVAVSPSDGYELAEFLDGIGM